MKKLFLILLLSITGTFAAGVFSPDVEIKINGLVCPSCAIGLKNSFKKNIKVKGLKMDTKKGGLALSVALGRSWRLCRKIYAPPTRPVAVVNKNQQHQFPKINGLLFSESRNPGRRTRRPIC